MTDRSEIAARHGIPHLAEKLVGQTDEELEADAAAKAALLSLFRPKRSHVSLTESLHPEEGE